MQLQAAMNNTGMLGFQLPTIPRAIPQRLVIQERGATLAQLALDLVMIGVINPSDIPPGVATPADVVKHGLEPWFDSRTQGLNRLHFTFGMIDSASAKEMLSFAENDDEMRQFGFNPVLAITTPMTEYVYTTHRCAVEMEAVRPGLYGSILNAIREAKRITVPLFDPSEMFDAFAESHWDGDTRISTREARPILIDRLGDDGDWEKCLPKVIKPLFGYDLWRTDRRRNTMTAAQLRRFAEVTGQSAMKHIVQEAALLLDLCEEAKAKDARLPSLDRIWLRPYYLACHIVYQDNEHLWAERDTQVNYTQQGSDGTDCVGLHELPSGRDQLATYFNTLDIALGVTRQMDKVISLISEPLHS